MKHIWAFSEICGDMAAECFLLNFERVSILTEACPSKESLSWQARIQVCKFTCYSTLHKKMTLHRGKCRCTEENVVAQKNRVAALFSGSFLRRSLYRRLRSVDVFAFAISHSMEKNENSIRVIARIPLCNGHFFVQRSFFCATVIFCCATHENRCTKELHRGDF